MTWKQLVALHRQWHSLVKELRDAECALGRETTEANYSWLQDVKARLSVLDGTEAQGDFKVRRLEPFKCATVLYGGPISSIPKAYEKVFGGLGGATPTGETREYYFHFEGVESPNNVQLVAVGLK